VIHGYARVSTTDQDLTVQREALRRAGCDVLHEEKRSGSTREGRAALAVLLASLHRGDVLIVTRIDRLARSIGDLQDIVRSLKSKGVALRATEQPIDMSTAAGKCFLDMLGVFAEFETNLRRERQAEGIARAKKAGVYKGRAPVIDKNTIRQLRDRGIAPAAIAKELGISRASAYRALAT
jgi:DNA invertase Pin-like site-specific DNA recombinase